MTKKPTRAADGDVQRRLAKTRIAPDLVDDIGLRRPKQGARKRGSASIDPADFAVVIEFNRGFPGGPAFARQMLFRAYGRAMNAKKPLESIPDDQRSAIKALPPLDDSGLVKAFERGDVLHISKSVWTDNYAFGTVSLAAIDKLSNWTLTDAPGPAFLVYKIWLDRGIARCVYESVRTVKCDAAKAAFAASGKGIVWAVADTGVDASHPHFRTHSTMDLPDGLTHQDFTKDHVDAAASIAAALVDEDGHGTHVAGIIAGSTSVTGATRKGGPAVAKITVATEVMRSDGTSQPIVTEHDGAMSGMAPECRLLSLKVLDTGDSGKLSNLLAALGFIQRSNDNGRNLKIHGLNLSLGYPFDPEQFAAGQSPLCVEVDRLVRSGVCVVVAAGNGGYGTVNTYSGSVERSANLGTIADPGNAALAITVGSTHRDMPHAYGVSYFSAKGPTSDGRMKPDLVAPGERIVSCARMDADSLKGGVAPFRIDSGTSMATPHVSGAIAAFLSVRGEFKGRPEQVKDIFARAATDLKRRGEFQGAGLLDLMRALQAV